MEDERHEVSEIGVALSRVKIWQKKENE